MTYDKKKIDTEIDDLIADINTKNDIGIASSYKRYDLKIKLLLLECANEIAGKLKDVL